MNSVSSIVIGITLLMVSVMVVATFHHKYDYSRPLLQASLEQSPINFSGIKGMKGEITSLQYNGSILPTWIATGRWRIGGVLINNTNSTSQNVNFSANITMTNMDGSITQKEKLTDFKLLTGVFYNRTAIINGTITLIMPAGQMKENLSRIPIGIKIMNLRTISIDVDKELAKGQFGSSPIYGKVDSTENDKLTNSKNTVSLGSNKRPGLNVQYKAGPVVNDGKLKVEPVATGITFPTHMAFLGANDILVLEKNNGTVWRITNGTISKKPLIDVNVANGVERGMLGIAVKKYENGTTYVFLYYTESAKDGDDVKEGKIPLGNRLYRYELVSNQLINPKLLLDLPSMPGSAHNGGKILVGHDNNIYLTIGDLNRSNAKKSNSTITKAQNHKEGLEADGRAGILRVTQDGDAVNGGILGRAHPLNKYFAYGIRNSFGIDFDPVTGKLWDIENGPEYGDEINLVEPGFNSGWNKVQGIWQPNENKPGKVLQTPVGLFTSNGTGHYSDPEFSWYQPSTGPTSIVFLNSDKLGKDYLNNLFVSGFHDGNIYNFKLNPNRTGFLLDSPLADKVANSENETQGIILGHGFGGITDMQLGPDGLLYVLSLYAGGNDCDPIRHPGDPCISYNKPLSGTIFKIAPK